MRWLLIRTLAFFTVLIFASPIAELLSSLLGIPAWLVFALTSLPMANFIARRIDRFGNAVIEGILYMLYLAIFIAPLVLLIAWVFEKLNIAFHPIFLLAPLVVHRIWQISRD